MRDPGTNVPIPATLQNIYHSIQELFLTCCCSRDSYFSSVLKKDPSESSELKRAFFFEKHLLHNSNIWTLAGGDCVRKV